MPFPPSASEASAAWPAHARALLHEQPYAAGTVDAGLLGAQTLVTRQTSAALYAPPAPSPAHTLSSRPQLERIVERVSGGQRETFAKLAALTRWCSRIPRDSASAEAGAAGFGADFTGFLWGGDEETVIAKRSPWPQELARVLASLSQIAGAESRLVFLYRADPPEMHTVVEAWAAGGWTVFDPCANRFFPWPHHGYASALSLQQNPRLVDQTPEHGRVRYVESAFYRTIGIASYRVRDRDRYNYAMQRLRPSDLPLLRRAAEVFEP